VTKADDSSLDPDQLNAEQIAARRALDRASGWGVFPTPIPLILDAAKLKVAHLLWLVDASTQGSDEIQFDLKRVTHDGFRIGCS
jgi:hypothetical protein